MAEKFYIDCERGNERGVRAALQKVSDKDSERAELVQYRTDQVGNYTPLHVASKNGHEGIALMLMEVNGIELNVRDSVMGLTPLHLASSNGHTGIVQALVTTGDVDVNMKDTSDGMTALHLACFAGHKAVVHALLEIPRIETNAKNDVEGATPLHLACVNGHEAVIQELLNERNTQINEKDHAGLTPLHVAAAKASSRVIRQLLNAGADTNICDNEGETPLSKVRKADRRKSIDVLLKAQQRAEASRNLLDFFNKIICCQPSFSNEETVAESKS
mmetsp:Transcript_23410/g.30580  ORF Transcript_23410/g.30580 Transcript_23410/m.30580 type:complete len:274 (+) Transcript_23410:121-942(+)|eukprot:CAMPEP_0117754482 /NCGR_PEP_ID=MMETSP0947-20121206/12856_1 /TAXON_ID=44440 /ORGANISM="Chattonella subsalsa, Strain CCMP2191" /LENGTH=273 /DNA_ID=CAMNT_0005573581 /DNA_START=45 /DNA_END=866 /DNA_ORIENTATION=-